MSQARRHAGTPRQSPMHLAIRFALEIATLVAFGRSGWRIGHGGVGGAVLAILLPLLGGAAWAVFRAPDDGAGPRAIAPVPGPIRLLIEWLLIGLGTLGLWIAGSWLSATVLLVLWGLHYAVTWDYVRWLWKQRMPATPAQ